MWEDAVEVDNDDEEVLDTPSINNPLDVGENASIFGFLRIYKVGVTLVVGFSFIYAEIRYFWPQINNFIDTVKIHLQADFG